LNATLHNGSERLLLSGFVDLLGLMKKGGDPEIWGAVVFVEVGRDERLT
jgi:hypothetical protein